MNWRLARLFEDVTMDKFVRTDVAIAEDDRGVIRLLGPVQKEYPQGIVPRWAKMLINQYLAVDSSYTTDMRTEGWVFSNEKQW